MEPQEKEPYEKPEIYTELISSETLRTQCSPSVHIAPSFSTKYKCNACTSVVPSVY